MLRYRGQYRVLFETDKRTGKACEFTYVPCRIRKGADIVRHNDDTLNVYIPGKKTANRLLKEHSDIFKPFQIGDSEATLLFPESMMKEAAKILMPVVRGKGMSPRPKRVIVLSDDQRKSLSDRMKTIQAKYSLDKKRTGEEISRFP